MPALREQPDFTPGSIVRARGREWIVLPESSHEDLYLRPLGSGDGDRMRLLTSLESVEPALFPKPDPVEARHGNQLSGLLLRDALLLKLRAGAGPFRAIGNLAFEPRAYQLVPLLMALRQQVVRLLIADDVGIGKTIEAGLILRELIDRGEVQGFTVLCPPHLCEQWQEELAEKFHLRAEIVSRHSAARLERSLRQSESLFQHYPYTIVSLDYVKSDRRRDEFFNSCPHFVIVDEAHTCVQSSAQARHQRYTLLRGLAQDTSRHLLLLTATPHSGDEEAFRNLLGLLDPAFATLERLDDTRNPLRQRLAHHMVQRRRQDIAEWQDSTQFPDREVGESAYRMQGEWQTLFQDVVEYARDLVERAETLDHLGQRMNWWAALALLRCISSSPAAAVRTLQNRIHNADRQISEAELDDQASRTILDSSEDIQDDLEPSAHLEDLPLLESLITRAAALQGPAKDPKLKHLITTLKPLLAEGYRPVVFCRYIPTAHYVAEALQKAFKTHRVACVTGELHPAEREEQVEALAGHPESPILVATDCLSEGINLQDAFDAVVHYDLAWNPTRHEQREGRVDRFGQRSPKVKALMLYGDNNPVDGAVLRVILRKAEVIRKALGVSVPMPEDENRVTQAIMQTVLLTRGTNSGMSQMGLAFDESVDSLDELDQRIEVAWESARDKARRNRTIFAQQAISPEAVLPEWQRMQEVLGHQQDVERFVTQALASLRAPLAAQRGYQHLVWQEIPQPIRDRLNTHGIQRLDDIGFDLPLPRGVSHIHRSHPLVTVLADELAERALAESGTTNSANTMERPARRAGAITTAAVSQRVIIALLRLRTNLTLVREGSRREMLAEEAVTVVLKGNQPPCALSTQEVVEWFNLEATQNTLPEVRERAVRTALERLEHYQEALNEIGHEHGRQLLEDHRRVRDSERDGRGTFEVKPQLPADVLGIYVLMPEAGF